MGAGQKRRTDPHSKKGRVKVLEVDKQMPITVLWCSERGLFEGISVVSLNAGTFLRRDSSIPGTKGSNVAEVSKSVDMGSIRQHVVTIVLSLTLPLPETQKRKDKDKDTI